nr:SCO family protein [Bacteroidota bacterium]
MSKRLIGFLLIFLISVTVAYFIIRPSGDLPVYHPSQLDRRLVDPTVRKQSGEHHIKDFTLIDQRGDTLRLSDTEGKIIIADFFFTTCATICPRMSVNLARVQDEFRDERRLMLLSHSVTPEIDSVTVLAEYAQLHGADPE